MEEDYPQLLPKQILLSRQELAVRHRKHSRKVVGATDVSARIK